MSIILEGSGKSLKAKLAGVAAAVALSGAAVLIPFAAVADSTTAQTIQQLTAQILAMQAQLAALTGGSSMGTSATLCAFPRDLTMGSKGNDVTCLQNYLMTTGHFTYSGGATGFFGSITRSAVAAWQAANSVTPTAGYFGAKSRAKYSMVAGSTGGGIPPPPPPPPPPGPGASGTPSPTTTGMRLSVMAASDQPAAGLAPLGATRVPFTRFTLMAGTDGAVSVKSMTVERQGVADDDAFQNVMIIDENGNQIGLTKTLNSIHQAVFNEPIVINAGQTRTFAIGATTNTTAPSSSNAGQIAKFALVAVDASPATVTGSMPIVGNGMTINENLTLGSVTMARGATDPSAAQTKQVGTIAYVFTAIRVTAGSAEKVYLKGVRWNQTGSAGSGDFANLKTYVDGSTAYDVMVSSDGKYYTTWFNDNGGKGILIDKGFSKDLSIKGDIAGGSGRTIAFDVAKRTDLYVQGETYNFGIIPPQTNSCAAATGVSCFTSTEDPWYDSAVVTVSAGTMNVSSSNADAAQNIAVNVMNQPLGAFTVDVKGEDISVASMVFNVGLSNLSSTVDVDDITNVTIIDENGGVIAGPVDGSASANTLTFNTTVTFKAGVHTYKLRGKVGTDVPTNATVAASTTPSSDWTTVKGQTTGNTITPAPSSAITLSTMSVKTGALTISVSSVPIAQNVIANSQNFVFANYILDATGAGEDIRLISIPLEYNVSSAGSATSLSNCKLWDGTMAVTTGGNTVNPTAVASSTSFTFDGGGLTISKGTSKTIALGCNVAGGAAGFYEWGLDSGQQTSYTGAVGMTSGQTVTETLNDSEGQRMTVASGGSLSVVLDSSSPGYKTVYGGMTDVELTRIKFSASNEDIFLKQLALQLSSTATNTPVDLVGRQVTLWDGGTQIGTAVFSTQDNATSSTITTNVTIPRDGSKVITVKGSIAAITASGPLTASGDALIVDYDGNNTGINGNYGTGVSSGATITPTGSDTSASASRIFKAYPQFTYVPLSSSERTLVSGTTADKTLYKFAVKAVGGDVALGKMTFRVSTTSGVQPNSTSSLFSLYSFTSDSSYSNPDSSFSSDGVLNASNCFHYGNGTADMGYIEVYPARTGNCGTASTTYTIPAGQTYYFRFAGTVSGVESITGTQSFDVRLEGDAAYPVPASSTGSGPSNYAGNMFSVSRVDTDTHNDLIWSPISTTTNLALTDMDYTNGYLIPGLPTTNLTAETFTSPN